MKPFRTWSLFLLILAGSLLGSRCGVQEKWHTASFFFFDTLCEVTLFSSQEQFLVAQEDIRRIFGEIDKYFSPEARDYSSPEVLALYQKANALFLASQGAFDISVGPLSKLWGFFDGNHNIPDAARIQQVLTVVGMQKIQLKKTFLEIPEGMSLDWGGIAKGHGIDLASRHLIDSGIARGFINAGGDLYCWGKNPSQDSWKIGIQHPRNEGFVGVLKISNLGAATAGDYQRFFLKDGRRYHHIFNPKTGYPALGKQSVTVIGPETSICDALSTALFVSSPEEVLQKFPEYGAVIVDSAGNLSLFGKDYPFSVY